MELIEKLKKQLSEDYGIHSDQELIQEVSGTSGILKENEALQKA